MIEILAAFIVLFAIIYIPRAIHAIIDIKTRSGGISPMKVTLALFAILAAFLINRKPAAWHFLHHTAVDSNKTNNKQQTQV